MADNTTPSTFDPARHLTLVSGREYLEVKWRLVWLRNEHPNAVIETELISHQQNTAVFMAKVSIPGAGSATGHGSEDAQGFGDYLEKAETKAIGRALAALGFGTQFCTDHDFGAAAGRVVDAPVAPRQQAPANWNSGQPSPHNFNNQQQRNNQHQQAGGDVISDRQVALVDRLRQDVGWNGQTLTEYVTTTYGADDVYSVSRRDASSLIEHLKGLKGDAPTQNQTGGYANQRSGTGGYQPKPASDAQRRKISVMWQERFGQTPDGAKREWARDNLDVEWEEMTTRDASRFIEAFNDPDMAPF